MNTRLDHPITLPIWWFIIPAYLSLWTVGFSLYSYLDGNGMMEAFGIDTGGASDFIMLNSGGRYIALSITMILGIWFFRTYYTILTALFARFGMDVMDLMAGLQAGVITDATGVIQSLLMFLLPNLISIWLLIRFSSKELTKI